VFLDILEDVESLCCTWAGCLTFETYRILGFRRDAKQATVAYEEVEKRTGC